MAGNQRGSHNHTPQRRADNDPLFKADSPAAPGQIVFIRKAFAGRLIFGELQSGHEACALDFTNHRVVAKHLTQRFLQIRAGIVTYGGDPVFIAQCFQVGNGDGRSDRVAGIGQTVGKDAAFLNQHLGHPFTQHQAAHRNIAGGQPFGDGERIGLKAKILVCKPFTGSAKAANHLIGAQQHVVFAANALNLRPVALRREDHPARPLERFGDKARDVLRAELQDLLFQLAGAAQAKLLRRQVAAVHIPVGLINMRHVGNHPPHGMHGFHAPERGGGEGRAVVAVPAANHHLFLRLIENLPVATHGADQHFIRFRTGVGVNGVAVVPGQQAEKEFGQLNHRRVRGVEEHIVIGQLRELRRRGIRQILAAVAQLGTPQS